MRGTRADRGRPFEFLNLSSLIALHAHHPYPLVSHERTGSTRGASHRSHHRARRPLLITRRSSSLGPEESRPSQTSRHPQTFRTDEHELPSSPDPHTPNRRFMCPISDRPRRGQGSGGSCCRQAAGTHVLSTWHQHRCASSFPPDHFTKRNEPGHAHAPTSPLHENARREAPEHESLRIDVGGGQGGTGRAGIRSAAPGGCGDWHPRDVRTPPVDAAPSASRLSHRRRRRPRCHPP